MHMKDKKPNILWLMTDEQRTDSLGFYGSSWACTPNLDKLAMEGVVFCNAVTPAPVCVPARVSLLTGKYPAHTGVWDNTYTTPINARKNLDHLTYKFKDAGYATASFGKHHYCSTNKAFDFECNCGVSKEFVHSFEYGPKYNMSDYHAIRFKGKYPWIFGGTFPAATENIPDAIVVKEAKEWLNNYEDGKPFFLRISFNGPHTPVAPPSPYDYSIEPDNIKFAKEMDMEYTGQPEWISKSLKECSDASRLTPDEIVGARRNYYGYASFLDSLFGDLINWMRKKGLLDNTIIAFVSDHGTHLGDYGLVQKQTFYEPVVTVPFFFWYPRAFKSGVKINTPVETRLMLPTLLNYLGLGKESTEEALGLEKSLCLGKEPENKPVFSEFTLGSFDIREYDRLVMVRDRNWKLSLCLDPEMFDGALFNLADDPYERTNLYGVSEYKAIQDKLSLLISEHIAGSAPLGPYQV